MAELIPFKGVLYSESQLSKLSGEDLLSPPYDIITPEYQEELYNKSPFNIVRVDFGKEFPEDNISTNKYTRAREHLYRWLNEQVLTISDEPCFYSYEISYSIKDKEEKLKGFLGLVKLEELGKGNIYPHECTYSKPKKDRLDLMKICEANISPIFGLYNSNEGQITAILSGISKNRPYMEANDFNGSVHRLWKIDKREEINTIRKEIENKSLFIADGHHRYETALEFQNEMREKEGLSGSKKPYDYVLMFLANIQDKGLTVLPTHILVNNMPSDSLNRLSFHFEITENKNNFNIADAISGKKHVFGLYKGNDVWYSLHYKGEDLPGIQDVLKNLDVNIIHRLIFEKLLTINNIAYEMDINKCLQRVREKEFEAAFFLNPTRVEDVENVALASLRMPPKSTYFYPKLLTGLVLNIFKYTF